MKIRFANSFRGSLILSASAANNLVLNGSSNPIINSSL